MIRIMAAVGRDRLARRGVMLAVVMVIVVLLIVLAVGFGFSMRANLLSTAASGDELQARLAAEAGIQRVIHLLRTERMYVSSWLNNAEAFHDVLVWSPEQEAAPAGFERVSVDSFGGGKETEGARGVAWRFSVVADDPADDEDRVWFGIVPESAKLNINVASAEQLTGLFNELLDPMAAVIPELVDSLLDWRDSDQDERSAGAESDYYQQLKPVGYVAKDGPFETVEELLLVKGFTAEVLFGEDYNRNGLLEPNENDGDSSLPPDNSDGELDRGLLPYLTVWSRELNVASDTRPRINIRGQRVDALIRELGEFFDSEAVEYIMSRAGNADNPVVSPVELVAGADSPLTVEDLPVVLDRLTVLSVPGFMGLINVNAAPAAVLATVSELEPYVDAILAVRANLSDESKFTPAWLHTEAGVPLEVLAKVVGVRPDYGVTTGAYQFSVESLGFADHVGVVKRIGVVLELIWPSNPQILYRRDLTPLGMAYRVHELEENVFVSRTG